MHSRLWISLTTTPTRIHRIRPVMESLVNQTSPFDGVLLNIPYKLKRDGSEYDVPRWLDSLPKVCINRCDDYGPATKLLGALEIESASDSRIIVVDDDTLYPPTMVEAYRHCDSGSREAVYCSAGFDIPSPLDCCDDVRGKLKPVRGHLLPVQVAEGYGSVLYRRGLFQDDVFRIFEWPTCIAYSDDLYFSNYLGRMNIPKFTIEHSGFGGEGFWKDRVLAYGREGDALHLDQPIGSNRRRYALAIRHLLENRMYWLGSDGPQPRQESLDRLPLSAEAEFG